MTENADLLELANQECALWQERNRDMEVRMKRIAKLLRNGGEEQIKKALKESEAASEEIHKAYKVDPKTLREPCTI